MYQNKRVLQESEMKIPSWSSCKKNPTATFTALLKNSRNAVRKKLLQKKITSKWKAVLHALV